MPSDPNTDSPVGQELEVPQSTVNQTGAWVPRFSAYATDIRTVSGVLSKGLFLSPLVASLLLSIGPPWPSKSGVAALTSVEEVFVAILVFVAAEHLSDETFRRGLGKCASASAVFLLIYISLFAIFVRDMPDSGHQDVRGFGYSPAAQRTIGPTYTEDDALRGAGYDPTVIWKPWTVYTVRISVVLTWLLFFCSMSGFVAVFARRR